MPGRTTKRVLGIDPFSRGVGFAVLEGPENLIDWGLKTTGRADSAKAIRIIERLIDRFRPDILAIEDSGASGSRRCERVRKLLDRIASRGAKSVRVRLIGPRQLRALGPLNQVNTKYARACFLADRFPELGAFLPRFRKPWMSEEDRMGIFDALGFALAAFPTRIPAHNPPGTSPSDPSAHALLDFDPGTPHDA
jgi:hypothetical protein